VDSPTRFDLYQLGREYLLTHATKIQRNVVDTEGSDANLFVGATSFMAGAVSTQLAARTAALFGRSAEREDLDRLNVDRWNLPRKGASPALGSVRFYRATATAGGGAIPVGTKINTDDGIEYITTTPALFGALSLEVPADVRATRAGDTQQVGRYRLVRIFQPGTIFDPTIQVINDEPTAGGEPRESDDDYRLRGQGAPRALARGTLRAIQEGATATPGVTSALASEVLDGDLRPARVVQLFIADGSGLASRALGLEALRQINDYRAAGIAVLPALSTPYLVAVRLRLAFIAGVSTTVLSNTVRLAVIAYINSLPTGAALFRSNMNSILARYQSSGLIPNSSSITEPTGDIYPPAGRTIRTTVALVTLE
jgi:hypothetical protein